MLILNSRIYLTKIINLALDSVIQKYRQKIIKYFMLISKEGHVILIEI